MVIRRALQSSLTTLNNTSSQTTTRLALASRYSTTPSKQAANQIYNPIRYEDEFETLNLLSSSSRTPLITLWGAAWCPSCKIITPMVKELISSGVGQEFGGVSFAEVELDSPTLGPLAMRYAVNSMPTLLAFDRQEAQLETRLTKIDDMKNREFMIRWIETEAKRHGQGGGGGTGGGLWSAIFGR